MEPTEASDGEIVAVRGAGVALRAAHHERVRERTERVEALMHAGVTDGSVIEAGDNVPERVAAIAARALEQRAEAGEAAAATADMYSPAEEMALHELEQSSGDAVLAALLAEQAEVL